MCSKTVNKLWNCLSPENIFETVYPVPLGTETSSDIWLFTHPWLQGLHLAYLTLLWRGCTNSHCSGVRLIYFWRSHMWKAIWPTFDILTYNGWRSEPRGANEVFGRVLTKVTMLTQTHFHCHSHLSAVWRTWFKWFLSELRHFALSPEIGWPVTNDSGRL